jgi:antitoxin HicB
MASGERRIAKVAPQFGISLFAIRYFAIRARLPRHCFVWYHHHLERGSNIVADDYSFSVVLEPQEGGGFTVLVPALPEVVTEGDSEHEALANAQEAIRAILEFRREHGIAIPADAYPQIRRVTVAA